MENAKEVQLMFFHKHILIFSFAGYWKMCDSGLLEAFSYVVHVIVICTCTCTHTDRIWKYVNQWRIFPSEAKPAHRRRAANKVPCGEKLLRLIVRIFSPAREANVI